ncbi:MAG: phosphotransferase enzyme family protein [Chloroflexota bacterium]
MVDDRVPRQPALEPAAIAGILATGFGITPSAVIPVTSGHDAVTRAWRVEMPSREQDYFLKARPAGPRLDVAGRVARHLLSHGLVEVVAPIAARDGSVSVSAGEASLALFPFVDARRAMETGLRDADWTRLGRFTRSLHATPIPADLATVIPRERFARREVEAFVRVDRAASRAEHPTAEARDVAAAWREKRALIATVAERTASLGREAARRELPLVTCHADLHTGNVLVDRAGELWVVDWDEVVIAPKERDLMFFIGGISRELVSDRATASFLEGYGETTVDPVALAYYRYAWATQDVVGYAEQVLLNPSQSDADRAEAARVFEILFRPGEIVDIATSSGG